MFYIGNHVSSSKGFLAMGKKALELGGNTFAFFTRNPRGGSAKAIDQKDADALIQLLEEHHFGKIVAHAPYTMNVCAAKDDIRTFSKNILKEDLQRMEYLPGNYYNFHPGSHVGQGTEMGIQLIADALNEAITEKQSTIVLLETMAGKGSEVGKNFEEIQSILDKVTYKEKMGVCLDTCHIWDGGYDLQNDLDQVLSEFDRIIGLDRLKAIHFNDSLNGLGSHKDRHARLGEGMIGSETLRKIATHPVLAGLPFILETPNEDEGYAKEIQMVRSWTDAEKTSWYCDIYCRNVRHIDCPGKEGISSDSKTRCPYFDEMLY